jgi:uncharacterized protein (DUF779 family)
MRMENNQRPLEVSLTEGALNRIKTLGAANPQLAVTVGYVKEFSGGGGTRESAPHLKVKLTNRNVGRRFVKLESKAGVPVYISEPLYGSITKIGLPLKMEIGLFKKSLLISGLRINIGRLFNRTLTHKMAHKMAHLCGLRLV